MDQNTEDFLRQIETLKQRITELEGDLALAEGDRNRYESVEAELQTARDEYLSLIKTANEQF